MTPMSVAATGAPSMRAPRATASYAEVAFSSSVPDIAARFGSSAPRAVSPGVANIDRRNTRSSSCQNASPTVACSNGTSPTMPALTRSEPTLARRWPIRSANVPLNAADSTIGSVDAPAAMPVLVALPVVCRTNHGMARNVRMLPVMETALAASRSQVAVMVALQTVVSEASVSFADALPCSVSAPAPACTASLPSPPSRMSRPPTAKS